jgi:salicylate hydroxylase
MLIDYRLVKIINMIDKTLKWPLLSGQPYDKWVASSGRFLIIGDAAHSMLPYMSEGAAMAVEDGGALAEVLNRIEEKDQIPMAMEIFEKERILRTSQMQQSSLINGKLWHFADGPEQQARDEAMRPEVEGRTFHSSPNQWSDPLTAAW